MSWLGQNGASREDFQSLGDAYASMYEGLNPFKKPSLMDKAKQLDRLMKQAKDPFADTSIKKEAFDLWVQIMIEEGVDFSDSTDEEVTEYFLDEVLAEGLGTALDNLSKGVVKKTAQQVGSGAQKAIKTGSKIGHGIADGAKSFKKGWDEGGKPRAVKEESEELDENVMKKLGDEAKRTSMAYTKGAGHWGKDVGRKISSKAPAHMRAANVVGRAVGSVKDTVKSLTKKEETEILASLQDAYNMMYEKKKDSDKCGDDTYWDKEEKKCKSKKKSSKTVVVGRGGIYGPGYHGGGGGSNGDGDGDGGDTDGGDGGGDGGGGGGGE